MRQASTLRADEYLETPAAGTPLIKVRFFDAVHFERLFTPSAHCAQLSLQPFTGEATALQTSAIRIVTHSTHAAFQMQRYHTMRRISLGYFNKAHRVMQRGRPFGASDVIFVCTSDAVLNFVGPAEFVWLDIDLSKLPETGGRALLDAIPTGGALLSSSESAVAALRQYVAGAAFRCVQEELLDKIYRILNTATIKTADKKREKAFARIRQIEQYMWDNVEESLSLPKLCSAAGCSARSLTYDFKSLAGVGPMTYLKIRRLESVHRRLCELFRTRRIFDVAADFGFWHMGHFSADYKRMFATTPSATLAAHSSS